ncbi:MAG: Prolyl endopeptidase [Ignavibacteria bacterium]|nr:Prolyl endopeptidase [Ignavibacteria bacterium]
MKRLSKLLLVIIVILFYNDGNSQWIYPESKTADSIEIYFGETIEDPYQWLEDIENSEVKDWFKVQSDYTLDVISKIPNRDKLVNEMKELDKSRKIRYGTISERAGKYFFEKRLAGEEIYSLYMRENQGSADILIFDPENYDSNVNYTIQSWVVSDDAGKILLGLSESGKEKQTLRILDVKKKSLLPENFKVSYVMDWLPESNDEFMYLQLQSDDVHKMESTQNSRVKIHKLGTDQSKDKIVLSRDNNPELNINPEDYPYMFYYNNSDYIFAGKGTVDNNQEYFYAPKSTLKDDKIKWKQLTTKDDKTTYAIADKNNIYFLTSKDAPNYKVIRVSLDKPDLNNPEVVIPESEKVIVSINSTRDYMIISHTYNGIEFTLSKMKLTGGKAEKIELPLKGSIYASAESPYSNICNLWNSSWTEPSNTFTVNLEKGEFSDGPFNVSYEIDGIENLVSETVEVISHDGEKVPLSIVYNKNLMKKDGSNICYIDGYGAYGYSTNPYFNTFMMPLMNRGVIMAYAHVRGGSEKGENWYRAGWKSTKPNTWKDFIACAQYLVDKGYTSKEKLAGTGTSAGGILIGRAITERPDLFKVAIPKVGCMNTLRGEFSPNGPVNIPEFGTVAIEEEYKALKEMDSYFHLKSGEKYPATLITTGFNDPRVISWIPAKFAAKMQSCNSSSNPILLHVDYSTGHFGGETMTDYFQNLSDICSFIMWQCGNEEFQPKNF